MTLEQPTHEELATVLAEDVAEAARELSAADS